MVAKAAGVSISTVSLIMNGHYGRVSDATRKRVMRLIDELGYRPNLLARTMKTRKSKTIGIIVEGIAEGWFSQILFGAEEKLRQQGYQVILGSLYFQKGIEEDLKEAIDLMLSRQVDGIILISGSGKRSIASLQVIISLKIPLVLVGFYPSEDIRIPKLYLNYEEAGRISVDHLYSLGKRKIAFIGTGKIDRDTLINASEDTGLTIEEILRGYRQGLTKFNLPLVKELIWIKRIGHIGSSRERLEYSKGKKHYDLGKLAMKELLSLQETPDAIYCMHDQIAYGAIVFLQERGIKIPGEIAVMGNNNLPYSDFTVPGLTSVDMHLKECGYLAASSLLRIFDGEDVALKMLGPVSLVIRPSTQPDDKRHG